MLKGRTWKSKGESLETCENPEMLEYLLILERGKIFKGFCYVLDYFNIVSSMFNRTVKSKTKD